MKYCSKVKRAEAIGGYHIRAMFRDGYIGEVDLWPLFEKPHGPLKQPFKDPSFFAKVFLDHGTVAWPNGFDICSDVLRYDCEIGRVCSREELAAAFSSQPSEASSAVLNDKPNP